LGEQRPANGSNYRGFVADERVKRQSPRLHPDTGNSIVVVAGEMRFRTFSPVLAEPIGSRTGQLGCDVRPDRYLHLLPLVGTA
jgi:hypothetical protein